MRVLITGGAGFIGANLCRHLQDRPGISSVAVIDDLSTGALQNLAGREVEFRQDSILNTAALDAVVPGADAIVHVGAIPSVPRSIANTTGTLNVLEAARAHGVGQVIVASSSSVYGSNPKLPKSEYDWTRPMSPYAVSKQATEGYALAYQFSYGLPTLAFRFFNVYGPLQSAAHAYAAVIPKFVDAALHGRPVEVHGDGLQSRDFTYVDTVCSVIGDAIERRVQSPDPVNLAFNTNTSLIELLGLLEDQVQQPVARHHTAPRTGDVRASRADDTRLRELFPAVAPVTLEEGLRTTIGWYRELLAASPAGA